jgi:DNA-directed RNA polymerase specialized sigma24 family protein
VARRLAECATLSSAPYAFIQGVAINVAREQFRQAERRHETLDKDVAAPFEGDPITRIDERTAETRRRSCLAGCVRQLPTEQRRALLRYHAGESRSRIVARQELAAALGIPLQALRLRMFRIRETLERCILDCIAAVNAK